MNYLFQVRGLLLPSGSPGHRPLAAAAAVAERDRAGRVQRAWACPRPICRAGTPRPDSSFIDAALHDLARPPAAATARRSRAVARPTSGSTGAAPPGRRWTGTPTAIISGPIHRTPTSTACRASRSPARTTSPTLDLRQVGARRAVGSQDHQLQRDRPEHRGRARSCRRPRSAAGSRSIPASATSGSETWASATWGSGTSGSATSASGTSGSATWGSGTWASATWGFPSDEALGPGDLNLETAVSTGGGGAPSGLTAVVQRDGHDDRDRRHRHDCDDDGGVLLSWNGPNVGSPVSFQVYRIRGRERDAGELRQASPGGERAGERHHLHRQGKLGDGDHDADDVFTWFVVATLSRRGARRRRAPAAPSRAARPTSPPSLSRRGWGRAARRGQRPWRSAA